MVFQRVLRAATRITLALILAAITLPLLVRGLVVLWAGEYTYQADDVPARRVALVLGARVYGNGRPSAMLADRVATAAALYHAGRVDVLLMTGDNSTVEYNEPGAMRDFALELGVPEDAIVLDYGGRRTYDSCYRARHIFQVSDAIAVTQGFHLPRALLTCRALGIDTVGVAADYQRSNGYSPISLSRSRSRELPATTLAVIDLLRRPLPPVMGHPLPIFPPAKAIE